MAGGLLSYDDDGFLAVDLSTSQSLEASKHAANVFAFSKVCTAAWWRENHTVLCVEGGLVLLWFGSLKTYRNKLNPD